MADRPAHVLEIPESLGRDVDRAREGKLKKDLPVESFMSDAALEQVERQTREAAEPVHAEQLRPISPAEAARRRTFGGDTLPDLPQVRRVIPPPFRRPRIEAGQHGKTWQYVRADKVAADDIVPDVGLVTEVREETVYMTVAELVGDGPDAAEVLRVLRDPQEKVAVGTAIVLAGAGGEVKAFRPGDSVRVFRKTEHGSAE